MPSGVVTSKKQPKEEYPLTTASLIISPTLNFSIIFTLSSFLFDETTCLLETTLFPLTISSFISANFCSTPIKWSIFFMGLSDICDPGQNIRDPVSMCSTITPPLVFCMIFPSINSLFS